MKKVLFLLCACACLAATATIMPTNKANFQAVRGEKVMSRHTTADILTPSVSPNPSYKKFMEGAKKSLQDKKVNHDNLVNKRAPQRLSDDEIVSNPYVCFLYVYDFDFDNGEYVPSDPYFAGSGAYWYPDASNGLYFGGFYWDENGSTYYLPIDIDYSTGEVALPWGILLRDDSIIGTARNRTDTVWFEILVSQAYFEYDEQADCMGTLYSDGSIIFDDNYVYYAYQEIRQYSNRVLTRTEINEAAKIYVGTEILAANGRLDFIHEQNGKADHNYVYMFQNEVGDSLYVGNLWDFGVPNALMNLTCDSTMYYPCAEFDEVESITYLSNPIWDVNDSWISGGLGEFYPISSYELDEDGYVIDYTWGMDGTATPEQVSWPYTMPCNGYHFLYGYLNNVLTWINNGNKFIIPTPPTPPAPRGDVNNNGDIDIYDVITLIDHLRSGDLDDSPAFSSEASDCNQDFSIGWDDIDALYDYLLTGAWPE